MDIDSQIRNILERSYPVNDNQEQMISDTSNKTPSAIAVYGNNNVIIDLSSSSIITLLFLLSTWILYIYR